MGGGNMNAAQAYARAKLLASTPEIATVCEQFEHLAAGNAETPPTLAAHRVLAEQAPTPQSRAMHGAMAALLAQVCPEDAPLCLAHIAMWARITRYFIGSGVRQASMQFAMETEALVSRLNHIIPHTCLTCGVALPAPLHQWLCNDEIIDENKALRAERDAAIAKNAILRTERDALLVDTCHANGCGKCLRCRAAVLGYEIIH
jgi:hypothetical protein